MLVKYRTNDMDMQYYVYTHRQSQNYYLEQESRTAQPIVDRKSSELRIGQTLTATHTLTYDSIRDKYTTIKMLLNSGFVHSLIYM